MGKLRVVFLILFLLVVLGGGVIYWQGIANKQLAEHTGSYWHAGFVSLAGSALIGWMIVGILHIQPAPWSYELRFGELLGHMSKPGKRIWWCVGVPGGLFLPLLAYAIGLIGSLPAVAFTLIGWAMFALRSVRREPKEVKKWAWQGVALTFIGAVVCIVASNLGYAAYSRDLSDYWIVPIMIAAGASIIWQLTTLGQMGSKEVSSRLAASLVSWMGGALTAAAGITAFVAWPYTTLEFIPTGWPSPFEYPMAYAGMAYGVGIILIGAITSARLGPLKFIVGLAAGYTLAALGDSVASGMSRLALMLSIIGCAAIIAGVWVSMRSRQYSPPSLPKTA